MLKKKKTLLVTNPKLAKQWHPTKNGDLTPGNFTHGSRTVVWWKCDKADDHVWESAIRDRLGNRGCPFCAGKRVALSNCLATNNPELAKEWHSIKNESLTPYDVTTGSNKMVWWQCPKGVDHEYEMSIITRKSGSGCSICAGMKVIPSNSLALCNPLLSKQWHPTKNGNLTPYDLTAESNKKVWWKCPKGEDHEWFVSPNQRSRGTGCPVCDGKKVVLSNCLATTHSKLAKEWNLKKNINITPFDVVAGSTTKVWWKCDKGDDHEWQASPLDRKNGKGCLICAGYIVVKSNCLATLYPELAKEWHPLLNRTLTPYNVTAGTNKKVWWKCPKGDDHEWKASIVNRVNGAGCAICANLVIVPSNCLAKTHPTMAKEWHPNLNINLTPNDIGIGSHKNIWWKCDKGDDHEWKTAPSSRARGEGCSVCAGKKVVLSNCLTTINPKLAQQWHPIKNGSLTPYDVTVGSKKKIWWRCSNNANHDWITDVVSRSRGTNCPYCDLLPQSKIELEILFDLKLFFKRIPDEGYKVKVNGKLLAIDIYLPQLKLIIEYDGYYWHKDKELKDEKKTLKLIESGYKIIRLRESPLKKLMANDIVVQRNPNSKRITDKILKYILVNYQIELDKTIKIKDYFNKDILQNTNALNQYVENVLKRKSGNTKKENQSLR